MTVQAVQTVISSILINILLVIVLVLPVHQEALVIRVHQAILKKVIKISL